MANKGLFFIEGCGGGGVAGGDRISNPYEIKRRVQKI